MKCHACARPSFQVIETRQQDGLIMRRRECDQGHRWQTWEIPNGALDETTWARIRRAMAPPAKPAENAVKTQAIAYRKAGLNQRKIAELLGISVHMARYYTRLPREAVYPGAKAKAQAAACQSKKQPS